MNKIHICFLTTVTTMMLISPVTQATDAQDFAKVINLAGRQRMLSQKMFKELMLIKLNISPAENRENLHKTISTFDTTLGWLREGNVPNGIIPAPNKNIREQLESIHKVWTVYQEMLKKQSGAGSLSANVDDINEICIKILEESNKATELYVVEAKSKGVKTTSGQNVNIAGRQRMLSQRMAKALIILRHNPKSNSKLELKQAKNLFEQSHDALMNGNPYMEVAKIENAEVRAKLNEVDSQWSKLKPIVIEVLQNEIPSDEQVRTVAEINPKLLSTMNDVVDLLEKLAEANAPQQASTK